MSKRLEDFIKDNRKEFDELEPRAALWDNIEGKLWLEDENAVKERKTFSLGFVLRLAASVIVVMGVSFAFYMNYQKKSQGVNLAAIDPEYAAQQVHYTALITEKRNELKSVEKTNPDLYAEFSGEISKMDSTYKKLNKDLATSPNRELVLRAMIRNLQIQEQALSQQLNIIEQYNQMTKEQPHESKNI